MKFCLISNLYPPYSRGGAEQVVKNTVEGLVARGHRVVVITARPFGAVQISNFQFPISNQFSNPNDQKSKIQNYLNPKPYILYPKIYRFFPLNLFFYGHDYQYPTWLRFFWHILDVFNLHSYFVIRRILKKEKPAVVHTHNLKGLGYLIPAAIRRLGIFHVHTLHDVQLVTPSGIIIKGQENNWRHTGVLSRLYFKINRWLFGSPEVIISPSKFLLDFYEERGFFPRSKKVVIPNPVVQDGFDQKNKEQRTKNKFNFLYLGQIEEHKGVLFLIKVFRNFCSLFPSASSGQDLVSCSLHIVGAGSHLEEAKQLSTDCPNIIFHGKVERDQLPDIFAVSDITIVPSLCYENSPTVIFESFSFGVPVLASSIEGVAELIREGENGLTFEAGQEASLLEKLRWCLENQEKIRGMSPAALKSVEGLGLELYLDKLLTMCYNKELN